MYLSSKNSIIKALPFIAAVFFLTSCSWFQSLAKTIEPTSSEETVSEESGQQKYSAKSSKVTRAQPIFTTKVVWASVNLREGPGANYKIIGNAKKGTSLEVLKKGGDWFQIRLKNGSEAWVVKSATSDAPKPSSSPPPQPPPPPPPSSRPPETSTASSSSKPNPM